MFTVDSLHSHHKLTFKFSKEIDQGKTELHQHNEKYDDSLVFLRIRPSTINKKKLKKDSGHTDQDFTKTLQLRSTDQEKD